MTARSHPSRLSLTNGITLQSLRFILQNLGVEFTHLYCVVIATATDEAMTNGLSCRDRTVLPGIAAHPKESLQLDELSEVEFMSFLTLLNDDDCGGVLCQADEAYPGIAYASSPPSL